MCVDAVRNYDYEGQPKLITLFTLSSTEKRKKVDFIIPNIFRIFKFSLYKFPAVTTAIANISILR
jgi:hypothetical protein